MGAGEHFAGGLCGCPYLRSADTTAGLEVLILGASRRHLGLGGVLWAHNLAFEQLSHRLHGEFLCR